METLPPDGAASAAPVQIEIVVPARNEAHRLPGGLDALCRLRRLDPAARVVVMSAGGEAPLAEGLALGAATALHKPFVLVELLDASWRALAG